MINKLQIYRNEQPHLLVNIDEDTFLSHVVMGEHIISSSFLSDGPLDVDEGDYVILGGERFSINKTLPPVTKSAINELSYNLQFQGYIYDLHYCAYRHLGSAEFELFATADVFINIMVGCLNNIYTGWSIGQIDISEPKLIQFFESGKGFSCKGAILKIAEAFGLEFWLTGKTLNLTAQAGVDTNITFEYGRGRGLYEIVRGEIDNELYFNRLYVEGSTRNIPVGYRGGMKRLQIDVPYLQLDIPAGKRIRETSVVIEDIFPKRVGTITAVGTDWLTITDTAIDFDLNGQKIEGEKATVEMLTGENSGQSFEIDKYNHATKTIILVPNTETTGNVRPNATFEIKPGDQYFFAGIKVPESYINAAEAQLKAEGVKLLQKAAKYVPPYSVRVSDKFMRDNGLKINAGDRVRLKDTALGIDVKIRVSAVKFSLVDPYTVELLISDVIPYTSEDKNIIEIGNAKKETVVVNKVNAEKARRNMLDIRRLQQNVFDPDGYFDGTNIRPNSIETLMLSVGAKSQNYGLNGVSINANTGGDPNFVTVSQGALIHYEIQIEGLGYVWQMGAAEFPALDPTKTYFLSAKCRTTALTGEWVLSETPIKTEAETGYYHFYVGLFYPVTQGSRGYDLTNGMTFIVGDRITTGRIQSLDGLAFLDLTQSQLSLGTILGGLDWNKTRPNALSINGDIYADNATFIGLVVQNFIAGKVRITAAANNIRLVNETTNKIITLIDDDSAYEGEYWSTSAPIDLNGQPDPNFLYSQVRQDNGVDRMYYRYARRGPGMTTGTPGEAATSFGRSGVTTADINGVIKQLKQVDLITGKGRIRDNVFDGIFYDELVNKTTGAKDSYQLKVETINGKNYVVADVVSTVEDRMYNPYVIAGSGDDGNNGGGGVIVEPDPDHPVALTLAQKFSFPMGQVVPDNYDTQSTSFMNAALLDCDRLMPENIFKMHKLQPEIGRFEWGAAKAFLNYCLAKNMRTGIHTLLWSNTVAADVRAKLGEWTPAEFSNYIVNHIQTVMWELEPWWHIIDWVDVVNEFFRPTRMKDTLTPGDENTNFWLMAGVTDPIGLAFQAFNSIPHGIDGYINDYTIETSDAKPQTIVNFANELKSRGIHVAGIGSQTHSPANVDFDKVETRFRKITSAGYKFRISELDIKLRGGVTAANGWPQDVPGYSLPPDEQRTFALMKQNIYDQRPDLQQVEQTAWRMYFYVYMKVTPEAQRGGIDQWSVNDRVSFINKDPLPADFPTMRHYNDEVKATRQVLLNMPIQPYVAN